MNHLRLAAFLLAGACWAASTLASAAGFDAAEPSAYWRFDFGGPAHTAAMHYGLSWRQPDRDIEGLPLPVLAALDFSPAGAGLKLAGLPVWRRHYRRDQQDDPVAVESEATQGGWWSSLGVGTGTMLVAGGLTVAVLLLSTDSDDPSGTNDPPESSGNGMNINGVNENGIGCTTGLPPVPDGCLAPNPL